VIGPDCGASCSLEKTIGQPIRSFGRAELDRDFAMLYTRPDGFIHPAQAASLSEPVKGAVGPGKWLVNLAKQQCAYDRRQHPRYFRHQRAATAGPQSQAPACCVHNTRSFDMGMGFLSTIGRENEDEDPVGEVTDPVARFTEVAVAVGLIRPGDRLDGNMVELCLRVVELAARVGDRYRLPDFPGDTVGSQIRAELSE
jgi:hypothetical protein